MTDIHNPSSPPDSAQTISQLGETIAQTAESHRILAQEMTDRKSTRLNSSHSRKSRMPSSA